jgi:diguanylate cyclase (GGDEF)-like protein/PAS domain S-box-containing protein
MAVLVVVASVAMSGLYAWRTRVPADGSGNWLAVVALAASVAALVGSRRKRFGDSTAWLAIAASCAMTMSAYAVGSLGPSLEPDIISGLAAMLGAPDRTLLGLALLAMLGARSLNRDRYLMLESLIVSVTMAMLLWVFLLQPALDRSTMGPIDRWLSLVLPFSDLVLVAFATRLVLGVDSRSRSLTLLLLGLVVRLVGNSVAYWLQMAGSEPNMLVNVLIAVSLLLFAAAALDRSGNVDLRSSPPTVHLDRVRLATMLTCALLPQVVVLVFAVRGDAIRSTLVLASAIAALVTTLAIAHLWGLAVSVRDLTAREGEDRLASLVDRSSDVVVLVDANSQITYTSGAMTSVLGYPADRWYRWSVYDLPIEPTTDTWLHAVQRLRALEPETSLSMEVSAKHADGSLRLMELTAVDLRQTSAVAGTVLTLRDVTATRTLQGQLRFRADHDELTGLANRAQFLARLNRDLLANRQPIVMFIDLDDFKSINDTLGHESGDILLTSVGTRLQKRIPDERGLVARLGGDEFAIILLGIGVDQAIEIGTAVMDDLREPIRVNPFNSVSTSCSIGIAQPESHDTASALLRNADLAMYRAKRRGKGFVEVFDADLEREVARSDEYRRDLLTALGREQFTLVYQPIVRIEDGRVVGAEALIRWNHHIYGAVQPNDFIELAEQTGVIIPIGWWCIRQACLTAASWPEDDVFVTVNVSGSQLRGASLVDNVRASLAESGLEPRRLVLEITESMLIDDPDGVADELLRVRALGVRVALDDFGTGYSSLSYVQRLPLDIIKIDREFVQALDHSRDRALTRTIISMAQSLALETIGEGVEDERHADELEAMGCTYLQGYLFSHPLSGPALAAMLINTRPETVMAGSLPPPPPTSVSALPAPSLSPPSFVG